MKFKTISSLKRSQGWVFGTVLSDSILFWYRQRILFFFESYRFLTVCIDRLEPDDCDDDMLEI